MKKIELVLIPVLFAAVLVLSQSRSNYTADAFDRISVDVGQAPASVAVADVNHDGHPDILVLNTQSETLSVLLGDARGHFRQSAMKLAKTGKGPNDIAVGDFNGDGNLDIAIPNTGTPYITILLGDGKGGFTPSAHSPFATSSHPHVHGVAAADFNSDGKLDLVTDSWGENKILLFFGDGRGNLALPGHSFATGKRPYQRLRSADFNKDGRPDVVTTDLDENAVSILLNDGRGQFRDAPGSPFPAGGAPWALAIDDLNKDSNPDLAVIPYDRDLHNAGELGVTVLLGDGKGGFRKMPGSPFSLDGCTGPDRVATGDVNGDGLRDIVVTCAQNDTAMIFFGTSGGSFRRVVVSVPTGWSGLAVADLDGDGKDDIIVSNNHGSNITILRYRPK